MTHNASVNHSYRIEVKVPRVAREGLTWRTLLPPSPLGTAEDVGRHLRESMLEFGFDADRVDAWFQQFVRCVEYQTETTRVRELPMTERS